MSGKPEQIAVIGDGQMGLVLSDVLAERGVPVRLWGPTPEKVERLAATRRSTRLPGFVLPDVVEVSPDPAAVLAGATMVLNAIPTQYIRSVWTRIAADVPAGAGVVCVSKGIEAETLLTPTEVIQACVTDAGKPTPAACSLSGPTIAAEIARHLPATMVAASPDEELARRTQDLFTVKWIRVYRHDDLRGVELAGAMKNVIALAAGMIDGLELGHNAKSALLARGLAEIGRFGTALGARIDTFFGVAGVGDLATTCFSPYSRNRTCGERIGRGETLQQILDSMESVVEGVPTTRAIHTLAKRHKVDLPITVAVHSILFEGKDPMEAVWSLMRRQPKAEQVG